MRKYDSTMTVTHSSSTVQHYNVKRHQLTNECLKALNYIVVKRIDSAYFLAGSLLSFLMGAMS